MLTNVGFNWNIWESFEVQWFSPLRVSICDCSTLIKCTPILIWSSNKGSASGQFWAKLGYSRIKIDHFANSLLKLQIKIGVHLINIELSQLLTLTALHLLARQRRADLNREIKSCSGKTCRSIYLPCASKWNLRPLFDTAPAKQLIVGDHDFEMDFSSLWPALACLSLPLAHKTGSKYLWSRIAIFKSPMQFHKTWRP